MPRLRRSDLAAPGYTRQRRGRGFSYRDPNGHPVDDAERRRIEALVIPPAWVNVWICPWPNGHIQATGVDARGRLQYRYHDQWRVQRDREKFDHMLDFAEALPDLRAAVAADLDTHGLGRDRVLAAASRLLDIGFFRIGSECYVEENGTHGLATLHRQHVRVSGNELIFDYPAKDGKRRLQAVVDPKVREVVTALLRRRSGSGNLLAWKADGRSWVDLHSADINSYVKDRTGVDCSAKDFRTWNATVLAAVALSVSAAASTASARKRCVSRAMKEVAEYLGDTPEVTRRSYVDPRVVDRYLSGHTVAPALAELAAGARFGHLSTHGAIERAVLDLIDSGRNSERLAA